MFVIFARWFKNLFVIFINCSELLARKCPASCYGQEVVIDLVYVYMHQMFSFTDVRLLRDGRDVFLLRTSKRARATHVIYYVIKTYIMNLISHLACFFTKPLMPNDVSTLES
jgi:hypothetical protein